MAPVTDESKKKSDSKDKKAKDAVKDATKKDKKEKDLSKPKKDKDKDSSTKDKKDKKEKDPSKDKKAKDGKKASLSPLVILPSGSALFWSMRARTVGVQQYLIVVVEAFPSLLCPSVGIWGDTAAGTSHTGGEEQWACQATATCPTAKGQGGAAASSSKGQG